MVAKTGENNEAVIMWDKSLEESLNSNGPLSPLEETKKYLFDCYQSGTLLLKSFKKIISPDASLPNFNDPIKIDDLYKKRSLYERISLIWKTSLYALIDLAFINQEGIQFYHNPSRATLIPIFRSYTFIALCLGTSYFYGLAMGIYLFASGYLFIAVFKLSQHKKPF